MSPGDLRQYEEFPNIYCALFHIFMKICEMNSRKVTYANV
jgi:hypothetical protein